MTCRDNGTLELTRPSRGSFDLVVQYPDNVKRTREPEEFHLVELAPLARQQSLHFHATFRTDSYCGTFEDVDLSGGIRSVASVWWHKVC